jgi:hypothetical protein
MSPASAGTPGADPQAFPAKVIKDHVATDESQLALRVGQIIYVLEQDASGWWGGHHQNEDETGWFPGASVQRIADTGLQEDCAKTARPSASSTDAECMTVRGGKAQAISPSWTRYSSSGPVVASPQGRSLLKDFSQHGSGEKRFQQGKTGSPEGQQVVPKQEYDQVRQELEELKRQKRQSEAAEIYAERKMREEMSKKFEEEKQRLQEKCEREAIEKMRAAQEELQRVKRQSQAQQTQLEKFEKQQAERALFEKTKLEKSQLEKSLLEKQLQQTRVQLVQVQSEVREKEGRESLAAENSFVSQHAADERDTHRRLFQARADETPLFPVSAQAFPTLSTLAATPANPHSSPQPHLALSPSGLPKSHSTPDLPPTPRPEQLERPARGTVKEKITIYEETARRSASATRGRSSSVTGRSIAGLLDQQLGAIQIGSSAQVRRSSSAMRGGGSSEVRQAVVRHSQPPRPEMSQPQDVSEQVDFNMSPIRRNP